MTASTDQQIKNIIGSVGLFVFESRSDSEIKKQKNSFLVKFELAAVKKFRPKFGISERRNKKT